jgi:hypothetical protein
MSFPLQLTLILPSYDYNHSFFFFIFFIFLIFFLSLFLFLLFLIFFISIFLLIPLILDLTARQEEDEGGERVGGSAEALCSVPLCQRS